MFHALGHGKIARVFKVTQALLEQHHKTEQDRGKSTWCSSVHNALWAQCLERSVTKTTPVFWSGGNRWLE